MRAAVDLSAVPKELEIENFSSLDRRVQLKLFLAYKNDPNELFDVGTKLLAGTDGFPLNTKTGFRLIKKSSEESVSGSFELLGDIYESGKIEGIEKDINKAIYYYQQAIKSHYSLKSMRFLGDYYFERKEYDKALKMFRMAAALDDYDYYAKSGYCFQTCLFGTPQNIIDALSIEEENELFIKNVIYNKDLPEKEILEKLYLQVQKAEKTKPPKQQNFKKAVKLYKIAVKHNSSVGCHYLGICYENGYGVHQNYVEANRLFKLGFELNGNIDCGMRYYLMVGRGRGSYPNKDLCFEKIIGWFLKMSNNDVPLNPFIYYALAIVYSKGIGVKRDKRKAFEYLQRGSELGEINCCENIAFHFEKGDDFVSKDFKKANSLFKYAADNGSISAMKRYADFLQNLSQDNKQKGEQKVEGIDFSQRVILRYYEKSINAGNYNTRSSEEYNFFWIKITGTDPFVWKIPDAMSKIKNTFLMIKHALYVLSSAQPIFNANKFLLKAIKHKDYDAYLMYGVCISDSRLFKFESCEIESEKYIEKAFQRGISKSTEVFFLNCLLDLIHHKENKKAERLNNIGCKYGCTSCLKLMAEKNIKGIFGQPEIDGIIRSYELSAMNGDISSYSEIGKIYELKMGNKNLLKALKFYRLAKDKDNYKRIVKFINCNSEN